MMVNDTAYCNFRMDEVTINININNDILKIPGLSEQTGYKHNPVARRWT